MWATTNFLSHSEQMGVLGASVCEALWRNNREQCLKLIALCEYIVVIAGKFWGMGRVFAWISPNLPEKLLCDFWLQIFSHKDHEDLLLVWPPRRDVHVFFCKRWPPFMPGFFPAFQGFCPDFQQVKILGCACTPWTPGSYITVWIRRVMSRRLDLRAFHFIPCMSEMTNLWYQ